MPLYIDGEQANLYSLQQYTGDEVVRLKLKKAYDYLKENFWDRGTPVRFRHTKLTYGDKRGRVAESYEFSVVEDTEQGTKVVRYADSATPGGNGIIIFRPSNFEWAARDIAFNKESNKEKCLFIWLYICRENKSVDIQLLDEHKEARVAVENMEKTSAMHYFLFNKTSPLRSDPDKLIEVCYAWGISGAKSLSQEQQIMKMKVAIEMAEDNHDTNRGYDAFALAMEEGFSGIMEARKVYQIAIDHKKIKYNERGHYGYLDDKGKEEVAVMLKIPPTKNLKRSEYLIEQLATNPVLMQGLLDSIEDVDTSNDRREKVELPEKITREFLEGLTGADGFATMKKMLTDIHGSWKGKKKPQIISELIDYYVVNAKD